MNWPYRDETAALLGRVTELEAAAARGSAIEQAAADAELAAVRRELATMEAQRRGETAPPLPTLDQVRVASPCPAKWREMEGDERVRFCAGCQKSVFNLSAMTTEEATRFVRARSGEVCVRFYRRADGTFLTSDCPAGIRKRRKQRVSYALAFSASAAAILGGRWLASLQVTRNAPSEYGATQGFGTADGPSR